MMRLTRTGISKWRAIIYFFLPSAGLQSFLQEHTEDTAKFQSVSNFFLHPL